MYKVLTLRNEPNQYVPHYDYPGVCIAYVTPRPVLSSTIKCPHLR